MADLDKLFPPDSEHAKEHIQIGKDDTRFNALHAACMSVVEFTQLAQARRVLVVTRGLRPPTPQRIMEVVAGGKPDYYKVCPGCLKAIMQHLEDELQAYRDLEKIVSE